MSHDDAMLWLSGDKKIEPRTQISDEIDYFLGYYQTLRPTVFISYEREAYYSAERADFRVTFDENILVRESNLSLCADVGGTPILPDGTTLMEIKCSGGRSGERVVASSSSADSDSSSMKGLKSGNGMLISKGEITIDSADDAIHSDISATINGGTFEIASGDDALHAEENLTVTNGKFNITHSYEGLEAMHITVSGGDIKLKATDYGLNAAGGNDSSGDGGRDNMFGAVAYRLRSRRSCIFCGKSKSGN